MSRLVFVGRDEAGIGQLQGVLADAESCRVLRAARWPAGSQPATVGRALLPLLEPDSVVVLDSGQDARDLAGWLAMTRDAPVVWAAETIRSVDDGVVEVVRTAAGGRSRVVQEVGAGLAVVLAKPAGRQHRPVDGLDGARVTVETFDVADDTDGPVLLSAPEPMAGDRLAALVGAEVVVSVGRGIGGPESLPVFRDLAQRLGAALGASRVVVDSGWLPFAHQVGQTGASVAPGVYLAFGISGAVQHLAGMRGSEVVVAVNTDRDAPLCRVADLVVEGDAVKVAAELLDRLGDGGTTRPT